MTRTRNMALSVVEQLLADGDIDQDRLAASFSARFDPGRQYGPAMNGLLPALELEDWRFAAAQLFGGRAPSGTALRCASPRWGRTWPGISMRWSTLLNVPP